MTTAELQKAVKRRSFVPFTIRIADGASYRVPGAEWVLYPKPSRLCFVFDVTSDGVELLDLLTMTSIKYDHMPPADEGNSQ